MYTLSKEEDEAMWKALRKSTKLIGKGRLVKKNKKEEDHDLRDESVPVKESKDR